VGKFEVTHVVFSQDRKRLVYSSTQDDTDRLHIWTIDAEHGSAVRTAQGHAIEDYPQIAADGALFALQSDGNQPLQPVALSAAGQWRRLAPEAIPSSFPSSKLVMPQAVIFTAKDGQETHAQLFLPRETTSKPHPAILARTFGRVGPASCRAEYRFLPPAQWIAKPGAFPALVDQETFDRVQKNVIRKEDRVWSNEELKRRLTQLLAAKGRLSESIILNARGMCSTSTLKRRLGGYREIYETVGYRPLFRDFYKGPHAEASMRLRRELVERISTMFPGHVQVTQQRMRTRSILLVDNFFYVAVLMTKVWRALRSQSIGGFPVG
jgi:hypothetical protein